uniref:DNL-type domain-containing protein n=1 Tax=Steinernema glaseri TaxID=37863 RepID=A0A1I7YLB5_9BILA
MRLLPAAITHRPPFQPAAALALGRHASLARVLPRRSSSNFNSIDDDVASSSAGDFGPSVIAEHGSVFTCHRCATAAAPTSNWRGRGESDMRAENVFISDRLWRESSWALRSKEPRWGRGTVYCSPTLLEDRARHVQSVY